MEFELYKWYETSEYNLMYSLLPWKRDILEYGQGILLHFENGSIVFDRDFYYNENIESGRNYPVKRFMIISL